MTSNIPNRSLVVALEDQSIREKLVRIREKQLYESKKIYDHIFGQEAKANANVLWYQRNKPGQVEQEAENESRQWRLLDGVSREIVARLSKPACRTPEEIAESMYHNLFRHDSAEYALRVITDEIMRLEDSPPVALPEIVTPASWVRRTVLNERNSKPAGFVVARIHRHDESEVNGLGCEASIGGVCESVDIKLSVNLESNQEIGDLILYMEFDGFSPRAAALVAQSCQSLSRSICISEQMLAGDVGSSSESDLILPQSSIVRFLKIAPWVFELCWAEHPKSNKKLTKRLAVATSILQRVDESADPLIQIVLSVVAIEAILVDGNSSIADKFASRAGTLLTAGGDLRPAYCSAFRKLYDIRSRFIHGESLEVPEFAIVRAARAAAGVVLSRCFDWLSFLKKCGEPEDSVKSFLTMLDNAHQQGLGVTGLDIDGDEEPCQLLTNLFGHGENIEI